MDTIISLTTKEFAALYAQATKGTSTGRGWAIYQFHCEECWKGFYQSERAGTITKIKCPMCGHEWTADMIPPEYKGYHEGDTVWLAPIRWIKQKKIDDPN